MVYPGICDFSIKGLRKDPTEMAINSRRAISRAAKIKTFMAQYYDEAGDQRVIEMNKMVKQRGAIGYTFNNTGKSYQPFGKLLKLMV